MTCEVWLPYLSFIINYNEVVNLLRSGSAYALGCADIFIKERSDRTRALLVAKHVSLRPWGEDIAAFELFDHYKL